MQIILVDDFTVKHIFFYGKYFLIHEPLKFNIFGVIMLITWMIYVHINKYHCGCRYANFLFHVLMQHMTRKTFKLISNTTYHRNYVLYISLCLENTPDKLRSINITGFWLGAYIKKRPKICYMKQMLGKNL